MRQSLTPQQAKLFAYIERRLSCSYVAPSYEEMMLAMGLRSKSGIHRMVHALHDRGWITLGPPGLWRTITIRKDEAA